MSTTFLLSNMTPQTARLNRRIWARLESEVRELARSHGSIWVFTGTVYLDAAGQPVEPQDFIGNSRVAVPTHVYKAILCEHEDGTRETFGFLLPNTSQTIPGVPRDYIVSVDSLEAVTGLDFFSRLVDAEEAALELREATGWPVP